MEKVSITHLNSLLFFLHNIIILTSFCSVLVTVPFVLIYVLCVCYSMNICFGVFFPISFLPIKRYCWHFYPFIILLWTHQTSSTFQYRMCLFFCLHHFIRSAMEWFFPISCCCFFGNILMLLFMGFYYIFMLFILQWIASIHLPHWLSFEETNLTNRYQDWTLK